MTTKTHLIFGADHAGYDLKEQLIEASMQLGYNGSDITPEPKAGDDYPPIALQVAQEVLADKNALGVLVCGTGNGMEIAANRAKGIRAFVARSVEDAELAREHNHANVIIFGGRVTKPALAIKILKAWLEAKPSRESRHLRRVKQLDN